MTWENLIIILYTVSLIMVMKHLDTMPGYSCPKYCGVDHKHWDLQSDSDQSVGILPKYSNCRDLAVLKKD